MAKDATLGGRGNWSPVAIRIIRRMTEKETLKGGQWCQSRHWAAMENRSTAGILCRTD
jgi:hypothetical protein